MPLQVFAVDATAAEVYSWKLGEVVYLEAKTHTLSSCGGGHHTGLVAHPTLSYVYVRLWLGWSNYNMSPALPTGGWSGVLSPVDPGIEKKYILLRGIVYIL